MLKSSGTFWAWRQKGRERSGWTEHTTSTNQFPVENPEMHCAVSRLYTFLSGLACLFCLFLFFLSWQELLLFFYFSKCNKRGVLLLSQKLHILKKPFDALWHSFSNEHYHWTMLTQPTKHKAKYKYTCHTVLFDYYYFSNPEWKRGQKQQWSQPLQQLDPRLSVSWLICCQT